MCCCQSTSLNCIPGPIFQMSSSYSPQSPTLPSPLLPARAPNKNICNGGQLQQYRLLSGLHLPHAAHCTLYPLRASPPSLLLLSSAFIIIAAAPGGWRCLLCCCASTNAPSSLPPLPPPPPSPPSLASLNPLAPSIPGGSLLLPSGASAGTSAASPSHSATASPLPTVRVLLSLSSFSNDRSEPALDGRRSSAVLLPSPREPLGLSGQA